MTAHARKKGAAAAGSKARKVAVRSAPAGDEESPPAALALPAVLDIRSTAATAGLLSAAIGAAVSRIDASAVTQADTAGLQLLVAARRAADARQQPLEWGAPSSALLSAAEKLGLSAAAGLGGSL